METRERERDITFANVIEWEEKSSQADENYKTLYTYSWGVFWQTIIETYMALVAF